MQQGKQCFPTPPQALAERPLDSEESSAASKTCIKSPVKAALLSAKVNEISKEGFPMKTSQMVRKEREGSGSNHSY